MLLPESFQLVLKLPNLLVLPQTPLPVPIVRSMSVTNANRGLLFVGVQVETMFCPITCDRRGLAGCGLGPCGLFLTPSLPNIQDGLTRSWESLNMTSRFSPLHKECQTLTKTLLGPLTTTLK